MNTLELKGGIHELISKVSDKRLLEQIHKVLNEIIEENLDKTDFWDELTEAQQLELDKAIEESYDEKNHISHEVMLNKYKKWLKP